MDVWTYTGEGWFVSRTESALVEREAQIIKLDPRPAPPDLPTGHIYKIVGVGDDAAGLAGREAMARDQLGSAANISRSSTHYLDITDSRANKGLAARSLASRLGLERSQIAAIGDMPNDVLMFRECGFSIAMGNADEMVKANADAGAPGPRWRFALRFVWDRRRTPPSEGRLPHDRLRLFPLALRAQNPGLHR